MEHSEGKNKAKNKQCTESDEVNNTRENWYEKFKIEVNDDSKTEEKH